jgi:hypothetical protein
VGYSVKIHLKQYRVGKFGLAALFYGIMFGPCEHDNESKKVRIADCHNDA